MTTSEILWTWFTGHATETIISDIRTPEASVREGDRSELFDYAILLRQGCISSLIRSNLYVNGLLDGLSVILNGGVTVPGLLFASDAVILTESTQTLQTDLTMLWSWCD